MVVEDEEERMERIYPKREELKQVSLYQAAELYEIHKERVFVMFPKDETKKDYERQTLDEFLEDCMFFMAE